jgi:general secretion pathway protein N
MRLDQARPVTWLLAIVAGWAVSGWLLALAGMGARIAPPGDDLALVPPLVSLQASPATHLAPLAQYAEVAARPLFAQDRRPHPFALPGVPGETAAQADTFDYVLNSVMIAPGFRMAIVEPAQGGESVRVRLGESADALPGWRLVELQPRSAVFEGPGGRRVLELRTWTGEGGAVPVVPTQSTTAAAPAPPGSPAAVAPAPTQVQMQMDAIRKRIEARRAQLRQEAAQPTAPARNP